LTSLFLADVRSVRLIDDGTRRDISEFASATASTRRRDAKTITVTSDGPAQREMVVSYTVAAPIWKTTYRVVLSKEGRPFFQGWAIIDNVSDEDWTNVQLSLVSGTPISFIQPIQQPFYRYRPVVPMPNDLRLDPQTYEPGDATEDGESSSTPGGSSNGPVNGRQVQSLALNSLPSNAAQAQINSNFSSNNFSINGADSNEAPVSNALASGNAGIETAATGSELGDLFEYRIDQPVTVMRDRSALIPIIQTNMEGERISIFNLATRADRAMGGLLLKNTSGLTFEGGSMTILDGDAYAGEALMERLKPAEQRLISFALDLGTLVTTRQNAFRAPVYRVTAAGGTLHTFYYQTDMRTYSFKNQTDKPRVIYVEHPVRADWELSKDTPAPAFTTARYYRFRIELGPYEKKDLQVSERHSSLETFDLDELTHDEVQAFVAARYIDEPMRAALEHLIELRAKISMLDTQINGIDTEIKGISEDQARLRENIKALAQTPEARQLIARYVAKADQQESRVEQLTKDRQTAVTERAQVQQQLAAAVQAFDIKRDL
jgi:archaellum component FlaC